MQLLRVRNAGARGPRRLRPRAELGNGFAGSGSSQRTRAGLTDEDGCDSGSGRLVQVDVKPERLLREGIGASAARRPRLDVRHRERRSRRLGRNRLAFGGSGRWIQRGPLADISRAIRRAK